jgi:hypothetical protein
MTEVEMSQALDFATPSAETLYALQRHVEDADNRWFDALKRGETGTAEKRERTAEMAEYRSYEKFVLESGLRVPCGRCGGDGVVHFGNVSFYTPRGYERTCFECGGARTVPVRKHKFGSMASTRFKRFQEFEAKQSAKAAAESERWAKFAAAYPAVAEFLAPHVRPKVDENYYDSDHNDFLCSMRESVRSFGGLTEKQMAAVERNMAKVAWEAQAVEFPRGTVTVEGEIVSLPSTRGYAGGTKMNMLVALSGEYVGNKVMGTIPEKVWDAMRDEENQRSANLVGSRVRFTATFQQSDRDEHFGFYKSPKQVEVTYVNWDGRS